MNIISGDYLKKMKQFRKEHKLELSDDECECYSNMFYVLNEVVNFKYTFEQLVDTYDFFVGVLEGNEPKVDLFTREDAFKGFY